MGKLFIIVTTSPLLKHNWKYVWKK